MTEEQKSLAVVEERQVAFYEDEIVAVRAEDGEVYIPLRPICDYLDLSWSGQRDRINRDAVLSEVVRFVRVTRTNSAGGNPNVLALPLEYLNGFLFGINAARVKEEARQNLIRYQRECYRILAGAFLRPADAPASAQAAAIIQVREMGLAIARMADEMLAIEQRTGHVESRLDKAAAFVAAINKRLTAVEQQVRAGTLTEEQAREIQHRVNLIAREMSKFAPAEKHHMGVYETLRHQTGATTYKSIPPKGYEAAIAFLDRWLESLQEAGSGE
jgi:hypothetical protein